MEYQKKTGRFPSSAANEIVTYYVYVPAVEKPAGILQIAHGMCEYVERYEYGIIKAECVSRFRA